MQKVALVNSTTNTLKPRLLLLLLLLMPTSTKPRAWKLNKMLNNGCNDFLFGVHCVEEGDRIPTLQSYGQALKQENCFSLFLLLFFYPRYLFPREVFKIDEITERVWCSVHAVRDRQAVV